MHLGPKVKKWDPRVSLKSRSQFVIKVWERPEPGDLVDRPLFKHGRPRVGNYCEKDEEHRLKGVPLSANSPPYLQ